MARKESDEIVTTERADKENKYEYKTNLNTLIDSFKDKLVMMSLEENPKKRGRIYTNIMKEVTKSVAPIQPGKQNPRNKNITRRKYRKNKKRST